MILRELILFLVITVALIVWAISLSVGVKCDPAVQQCLDDGKK